jgi:hypothetical protein
MNRVIKFRSWIKAKNKMFYDFTNIQNNTLSDSENTVLMQYTGLKERRNLIGNYDRKEIYEGDIIQEDGWDDLYVVKFEDCKFIAESKHEPNGNIFKRYDKDLGDMLFPIVVGNIYESPELLEV